MPKVIMSIKPEYTQKIISGEKGYEYRKTKCKKPISHIIIYETAPIHKVVAEVEVLDILEDTPAVVWNKTQHHAGINQSFFDQYFLHRNNAVAYCLGKVTVFSPSRSLEDYGVTVAPQSYIYLEDKNG